MVLLLGLTSEAGDSQDLQSSALRKFNVFVANEWIFDILRLLVYIC